MIVCNIISKIVAMLLNPTTQRWKYIQRLGCFAKFN